MNKSAFLELIKQATSISDQQTEELEKVAATFPYCQTAHLLLAKSAYDKGSMLSTQRLRRASAYATNRQLLKRIIYTSPVAEPVFEEPAAPPEVATLAQTDAPQEEPNSVSLQEQNQLEEPTIVAEHEVILPDNSITSKEPSTEVQFIEEEFATVQGEETEEAAQAEESAYSSEHVADEVQFEQHESISAEEEEIEPATELHASEEPAADILEQPMEKLDSELALLLTIKSLSPSFTDLLAQKPDETAYQAPEQITEELIPELQENSENVEVTITAPEEPLAQETPEPSEDDLAKLIAAETAAAAKAYFSLDTNQDELPELTYDLPETQEQQPQVEPQEDEVKYVFDEIDQMYQQDVLGYWMASSRMGEALQLKEQEEITRIKPQGFHPELILEYSKTHEFEPQEEPTPPTLHQQLNIIDQFLKINPRLKAMNNVKMKPEPQEDLSLKSSKIKRGIASESLANIFLKQGKVKKAIKIYEQLILKYPEKKSYFAEQIEKLQNLS
ncbi:tetratricopeptide repeat protein [Pontibacter oryzae]|uniref:Tetratricopeptide repeat protein n=1 Tax=Pontibacter oryzae TaxID=2304593 RepID=A0A399SD00_9BACT|nr:tetratricopeptide repeat protein [Pontibacter oryzae]RIJ41590.1 hypothetical protein D1627_06045 [Pontibacter oryzae]